MSGPTLCGVINKFPSNNDCAHFGDMCDGTGDEPGDSYDERRKYAIDGRYYDVSFEGFCTSDDLRDADDNEDEEGSTEDDIEVRGEYAHFCAMSFRQQAAYMATMRVQICSLIGVSSLDWEPSDAFILDAIQDETPNEALKEMAYAAYLATPVPHECNPSDVEPDLPAADDLIRVSQQGSSGKSEIPQDFGLSRSYRTRCKESNSRKKKCWHSNRRETIRRNADFFLEGVGENHNFMDQYVQFEATGHDGEFLTVHDQMRLGIETELTLEQQLWLEDIQFREYEYESFAYYDSRARYRRPYRPFDDLTNCTCSMCNRGLFFDDFDRLDSFDYYDPYDDWDRYAEPQDEVQDLVERFGDRFQDQDDIFAGFGETDADIDRVFPKFSSGGRFSYRFRGLSKRQQEALQR